MKVDLVTSTLNVLKLVQNCGSAQIYSKIGKFFVHYMYLPLIQDRLL